MISSLVKTQPKPRFYETFSEGEIDNIIKGLSEHKEIPFKYFYKDQMATTWDQSVQQDHLAITSSTHSDITLLNNNFQVIEQKKSTFDYVNIIDIGPGNCYPVKEFIGQVQERGWLNKYIALDLSQDILNLSQKNINSWFPDVNYQGYMIDFEDEDFRDIALRNSLNSEGSKIMNIVLFLGGTLGNHKNRLKVLQNLQKSLGNDDLLLLSFALRFPNSSDTFNYEHHISHNAYEYLIDLLNIQANDCKFVGNFNENTGEYFTGILPQKDYSLEFLANGKKQSVFLKEAEIVQIYRYFKYPLSPQIGIDSFLQEIEQVSLKAHTCNIDIVNLRALAICQKADH